MVQINDEHSEHRVIDGIEFSVDMSILIKCSKHLENVDIPESVKCIEDHAFAGCLKLKDVSLPHGLKSIGNNAFDSSGLVSTNIPNTVEFMGDGVFHNCRFLESVNFIDCNESLIGIGSHTFEGCIRLKGITLPNSILDLGCGVFKDCISLEDVRFPCNLISISYETFSGCQSIQKVALPETIRIIGERAFQGCSSLGEINIPESLIYVGNGCFNGCSSLLELVFPSIDIVYEEDAFPGTNLTIKRDYILNIYADFSYFLDQFRLNYLDEFNDDLIGPNYTSGFVTCPSCGLDDLECVYSLESGDGEPMQILRCRKCSFRSCLNIEKAFITHEDSDYWRYILLCNGMIGSAGPIVYCGLYLLDLGHHAEAYNHHMAALQHILSRLVRNQGGYSGYINSTLVDVILCIECCRYALHDLFLLSNSNLDRTTKQYKKIHSYIKELAEMIFEVCGGERFHQVDLLRTLGLRNHLLDYSTMDKINRRD